jgi:hypothetical protein
MDAVEGAPWALVVVAVGGIILGLLPLFWILRRLGRAIARRPQIPVGLTRYVMALASSSLLLAAGVAAGALLLTLRGYHAFTKRTHVAEVQCIELAPSRLRVYYVPIDPDGARGATETYDLDGDEWTVGGDVLRFRPYLTILGVSTLYKVTRVEGRWSRAGDANAHKATAFDIGGGESSSWLALYRDGTRGPLKYVVAGAHGGAVSQLPDRRAVYDLYVTDDGYIVDKRSM